MHRLHARQGVSNKITYWRWRSALVTALATLWIALPGAALAAGQHIDEGFTKQVDKLFQKWDKPTSPGCALSVMRDGHIIYKRGYGLADLDHDVPIATSTVFHVASVSKQFTAAAIVLLAQQGRLSLDDDIHKFFPLLPNYGAVITVRHLVHHTSGLRDQWELLNLAGWRYSLDLITDDDVLEMVFRQKELNFPPGERYVYSNTGYTLLAQIVKRVTGQSFREFTTSNLFEPLGMKRTHFRDDHAEIVKQQAYGYNPEKGGTFRLSVTNFDTVGATSLLTTVEDLAIWDENFYTGRVGGKALLEQMLRQGRLNNGEMIDYAFGLRIVKYRGLPVVEHTGSDAGCRSHLMRFPEQHFSVACLCNAGPVDASGLSRKVADIFLAKEFTEPAPPDNIGKDVRLSDQKLAARTGLYRQHGGDQFTRVSLGGDKLLIDGNQLHYRLEPVSENAFRISEFPLEVRFRTPMGDHPAAFELISRSNKPEIYEEVKQYSPTPQELEEYTGEYTSGEIEAVYRVAVEDGKLVVRRLRYPPDTLTPAIHDVFMGSAGIIYFARGAEGRVTGMILKTGRITGLRLGKLGELDFNKR
jgi:CubicO group peptidase (beta-lactamase class C family)